MLEASNTLFTASFLTPDERVELLQAMKTGDRAPATATKKSEYAVVPQARNVNRVRLADGWLSLIHLRLIEWMPRLRAHFGVDLESCQEPQFLAYSPGHFHRAHRDRGLAALEPAAVKHRVVSIVVFVNPGDYEGGALTMYEMGVAGSQMDIKGRPGGLIAFPSLTLHEVKAVTRGERYSIACWYNGPS